MSWQVRYSRKAAKEFDKLPKKIAKRVAVAVDDLESNPRPEGSIKLVNADSMYRIQVGDYRVIYEVFDDQVVVMVIRIRHRKDAYKP